MTEYVVDPLPAYVDLEGVGSSPVVGLAETSAPIDVLDRQPRGTTEDRRHPTPRGLDHPTPRALDSADGERAERHASRRLTRNFGALFGGQLVTWTMTLVWTLIVPRVLGPGGFGVINTALSVSGILFIFLGLGTRSYLVREMVINRDDAPKLVGTAVVLRLIVSPLVAVGAVGFAEIAHYDRIHALALYMAAAMNVAILIDDAAQAGFQATEHMKYLAYGDVINKSAQSVIGIAIALLGFGAVAITANMAVAASAVAVLHFVWLRRYIRIDLRTSRKRLVSMLRQSVSFWAMGLFFTFYLWIDTVLLSLMTGAKVVGWYAAATTLITTLMFLPNLMGTAWLPRLVSAFKVSQPKLFETARTPLQMVVLLSLPISAGIAMASGTIIHVLYGPAYGPAARVMEVLAFCIPPTYLNIITTNVLVAAGRQRIVTWVMLAAAVANPLMNLVLIPLTESRFHNGAIGAAAALDLTELLMAVAAFVMVSRHVFNAKAAKRVVPVVGASAAMSAAMAFTAPLGGAVALGAGGLMLLLLTVSWRLLSDEEIQFLRLATSGLRHRATSGRKRRT